MAMEMPTLIKKFEMLSSDLLRATRKYLAIATYAEDSPLYEAYQQVLSKEEMADMEIKRRMLLTAVEIVLDKRRGYRLPCRSK